MTIVENKKPLVVTTSVEDWEYQCLTAYFDALEEISSRSDPNSGLQFEAELAAKADALSDQGTMDKVVGMGNVLFCNNSEFIPYLKVLIELPQSGIPQKIRDYIADAIDLHCDKTILEHEICPDMLQSRNMFFEQAKAFLRNEDRPEPASYAASEYIRLYEMRVEKAKVHMLPFQPSLQLRPTGRWIGAKP